MHISMHAAQYIPKYKTYSGMQKIVTAFMQNIYMYTKASHVNLDVWKQHTS